jgi:menaquinone-dependent protoporphyrinogen oxidase
MTVLVAHASRHGATEGIARRLAETLSTAGADAVSRRAGEIRDLAGYDAVVLGSGVYVMRWLPEARAFAARHRAALSRLPVWLFSSGPLGTDRVDAQGRDVLVTSRPRDAVRLHDLLAVRGERVLFGAYDPASQAVGLVERLVRRGPASPSLPTGDFRDWDAIDAWAREIAAELAAPARS